MASLICWASGLLQIVPTKDVPVDSGPVVLMTGSHSKLNAVKTAFGQYRAQHSDWYVPGTKPIPADPEAAARQQQENMTLVIAFNKKIHGART